MSDNSQPSQSTEDSYSRVDYRRFVAWPARIQRERRLLESVLAGLPRENILDLGCGTGEHSRFFASLGYSVVGIDHSPSMLEKARKEGPVGEKLRFIEGDICRLPELVTEEYGGAISLGNTLPHLTEEESLRQLFEGLSRVLLPGASLLFQILNYERIFNQNVRHLPLNFRPQEDHELVFLRLMKLQPDDRVLFCPSTLRLDPGRDNPVEVVRSKRVELRGWQRKHLLPALEAAGFEITSIWGGMEFHPFEPDASMDLVALARRQ